MTMEAIGGVVPGTGGNWTKIEIEVNLELMMFAFMILTS